MKKISLYSFLCTSLIIFLLSACNSSTDKKTNNSETKQSKSVLDSISHVTDSVMKALEKQEEERLKNVTSIEFEKEVYNFGECTEGDTVRRTLEFTNTGKLPLVIEQAYGSCGCTVPTYEKEPIQPGKKGKLNIEFNSTNKPGANTKSVTIIANTNPPTTEISFSIKVKKKKK